MADATLHAKAAVLADAIEAELTRLGRWSAQRPPDEKFVDMGAFGMKTLSPEQWLQFVLLPNVRDIITQKGEFPSESNVSVWATRNFDGDPDADTLLSLLRDFDALFGRGGEPFDKNAPPRSEGPPAPAPDPTLARLRARLAARLADLPSVQSAYIAQLFFPATDQLTTPLVGLLLSGPISADAFAGMPPEDPFIAMPLAEDAVSRLLRMGTPFYVKQELHTHPDEE